MTPSSDTIPILHAEIISELVVGSATLAYQLPGFVTARLPETARLCDAAALAGICGQTPETTAAFLERLDQKIETWRGRQPFRNKDILTLVRALGGGNERNGVEAMLIDLEVCLDKGPAPRIAQLIAAVNLAVKIRHIDMNSWSLAGASALVVRHALRQVGIFLPFVSALVAIDSDTTPECLLSACLLETSRIGKACSSSALNAALLERATQEVPEMLPVIRMLHLEVAVPRGEVAASLGLPSRTARRRISALTESGWARSEKPKGPLCADVPPTVLASIISGCETPKEAK
jgi:hypothetical protein